MTIYRLTTFDRAFDRLTPDQQEMVRTAVNQIPKAFGHPHHHAGICLRAFGPYFECRASRALRILFLVDHDDFVLVTLVAHDHVRAYLKNNR